MTTPVAGQEGAAQDISGAVTSVIVRFVRARVGDYGLAQALAQAGELRPVQVLEDPRSWSTHDEAIRLLAAASQVTGDPDIGRHVGEEMLRQHDGTDVADLLRSLGSPGELLRNVTAAAAKFTTVSTLEPLEVGEAHAVVRAVTRPGFIRHIYMCEFSKGLLSQVPVLFGLVPAVVTETECQARGGRFCLYSVAWEAGQWSSFVDDRSSLFTAAWGEQGVTATRPDPGADVDADSQVALLQDQVRQMTQRLEEVFTTASDLLAVEDISELLSRITHRAAQSVNAPKYLLVVRTEPGTRAELHQHGFADDEARQLAEELWLPDPDDAGGSRLIVDIASPRQRYGRLAAVYPPGMRFMDREREIFALYANYAAAALDMVTALSSSRRSRDTAHALLEFSRALSRIGTPVAVAKTLADTVPAVIGSDRATVMLWDPIDQRLNVKALSGQELAAEEAAPAAGAPIRFVAEDEIDLPEDAPPAVPFSSISRADTPILQQLMSSRDIVFADRSTDDAYLLDAFERHGTQVAVMAPLFSDDQFLGVLAADYLEMPQVDPRDDPDLVGRLTALVDQAVTALQNAWLLEQVGHQAWHDPLTGLPNRRLLEDRVVQELERAKRVEENATMFFVDLDRFKRVNDTLGHAVGDDLLRLVAQRLRDTVRRQDTVARLGGDEFAILLPGLSEPDDIARLAERMVEILHAPYQLDRAEVLTSASIGVAVSPQDGDTYDELLGHADEAMYTAKQLGRNNFKLYGEVSVEEVAGLAMQTALAGAVERGEFFLEYQPYVKLATNRIVGVEALLRWRHPEQGVLRPGAFLALAEESGAIVEIDGFVINEAARQMRLWLDDGLPPLRISINISGKDLLDTAFVETVIDALRENSIPSGLCEIELGPAVVANVEEAALRATVDNLHAIGVRFSIDELGTAATTIDQVGELPIVSLKLDRTLLQGTESGALGDVATRLIAMANERGLDSVAKGIETEQQLQLLTEHGCTAGQGDLLSPPLDPADVLPTVLEWPKGGKGRRGGRDAAPERARLDTTEIETEEGEAALGDGSLTDSPPADPPPLTEPFALDETMAVVDAAFAEKPADGSSGPLLHALDDTVDPFEISPDVLSELGLDFPDHPADSDGAGADGAGAGVLVDDAFGLDGDPSGTADTSAPKSRKRSSGRTRTLPPTGPAF